MVSTASVLGLLVGAIIWGCGADIIWPSTGFQFQFVCLYHSDDNRWNNAQFLVFHRDGVCILCRKRRELYRGCHKLSRVPSPEICPFDHSSRLLLRNRITLSPVCLLGHSCPIWAVKHWDLYLFQQQRLAAVALHLWINFLGLCVLTSNSSANDSKSQMASESGPWCLVSWKSCEGISTKYNRPMSWKLANLQRIGDVGVEDHDKSNVYSAGRYTKHVHSLFKTKKLACNTLLPLLLWILIGLGDPLYSVFRPYYLKHRGYTHNSVASNYMWRNYAIGNIRGLVGPSFAWPMLDTHIFEDDIPCRLEHCRQWYFFSDIYRLKLWVGTLPSVLWS